jgi:mgtE-like transporter
VKETGPRRRLYDSVPAQTLIALSLNVISLFAGGLFSVFNPYFEGHPWILALFPPILTLRGGIGGIFSGNLSTMLHLGLIRPRLRGNTRQYNELVSAVFVITLIDTQAMGLIAFLFNLVFGRVSLGQLVIFLVIPTVSLVLARLVTVPLTSLIAITTFKKGLDPDILVYPILASLNDIMVTASFVLTVFLFLLGGLYHYLLGGIFVLIIGFSLYLAWRNRRVEFFHQTLREGTAVVILASLFGSANGIFLSGLSERILSNPGLIVVYPALTNALGNIGSIVGSTTTTNLALGYGKNLREEARDSISTIVRVESIALLMHMVFGVIAYAIVRPAQPGVNVLFLVGVAVLSNLSTFLVASVFSIVIAYQSFERGLNPDNIVIPVITTTSDTVATLAIVPALAIVTFLVR